MPFYCDKQCSSSICIVLGADKSSPYSLGKERGWARLGWAGVIRLRFRVFENLPAHRLAGVRKHDAPYSSRRAPCGLASAGASFVL